MKLKNMKITTELIAKFNPCESRFMNWKNMNPNFNGSIIDFLSLTNITETDKVWVACRVLPRDLIEIFAVDCAYTAVNDHAASASASAAADAAYAANAAYAADAADAAAYAAADAADAANADAAAYAAAREKARSRQVDALIYLVNKYETN